MKIKDTKPTWVTTRQNRGEPIWEFEHLGHTGQVVKGEKGYSAKLDSSGKLYIETVEEAKAQVEVWLDTSVHFRVKQAQEWLEQYTTDELNSQQKTAMIAMYEDMMGGARLPDGDGYDEKVVAAMYGAAQQYRNQSESIV